MQSFLNALFASLGRAVGGVVVGVVIVAVLLILWTLG